MKLPGINTIISSLLKGLILILPFFFLPASTSYVNFNKVSLVIFSALILLILIGVKILKEKRFPKLLEKKSLDYLILLFLVGHLLFTLFSSNPLISFFGEYGEWFPSFISTLAISIIYFAVRITFEKKDIKAVYVSLAFGIFISSFFTLIFFYFPIDSIYMTDSTFGPGREAAVYAILGAALSIYFVLRDDFTKSFKNFQIATFILYSLVVFMTGSLEAFAILMVVCIGLYLLTSKKERDKNSIRFIMFFVVPALFLVVSLLPGARNAVLLNKQFPQSKELNPSIAFSMVRNALSDSPIVGRGLGTELEAFTRNKPLEYNNSDNSDIIPLRFYSNVFQYLATIGVLGFALHIGTTFLAAKTGIFTLNDTDRKEKFFAGVCLIITGVCSFFFSTGIIGMFIIALLVGLIEVKEKEYKEVSKPFSIFFAVLLIFMGLIGVYGYGRIYMAETKYEVALDELSKNNGDKTFGLLRDVRKLNPYRSEYRKSLAQIELAVVSLIVEQGTLNETAQKDVEVLITDVTENIKYSTEKLNPNSTIEWENRGESYLVLSSFISGTEDLVIDAYNKAIELDPNNPHLRERIANIYLRFEDKESAMKAFNDAITLKPALMSARLSRAALFISEGRKEEAKTDLEYILNNADQGSELYNSAKTLLESL